MLKLVLSRDESLGEGPFELPALIKTMNAAEGDSATWHWATQTFAVIHGVGISFFQGVGQQAGKRWSDLFAEWMISRFGDHLPANFGSGGCRPIEIAKELDLDEDQALKQLLVFTRKRWERTCGNILELHALADAFYASGSSPDVLRKWAFTVLDAIHKRGLAFVEKAGTDFEKATIIELPIPYPRGGKPRSIKLVAGRSDAESFNRYARSSCGCRAGIVVQEKTSTGNKAVFTDQNLRLDLTDLRQIIRVEEQKARRRFIPGDWRILSAEGEMEGCPEWYFFAGMLLNGSLTHTKPPSLLSLNRLTELVQIGLDTSRFEPSRAKNCEQGQCLSKPTSPCPWFDWKLHRCRYIRFKMHNDPK